jgi:hypothetical protein
MCAEDWKCKVDDFQSSPRLQFIKGALQGGRDNTIAHLFSPLVNDGQLVFNRHIVVDIFKVRGAAFHGFLLPQTFVTWQTPVYAAIAGLALVINVALFFLIPKLPPPPGRLGQALGCLTLVTIVLIPVCLYNKLLIPSAALVIAVAFYIDLLMQG